MNLTYAGAGLGVVLLLLVLYYLSGSGMMKSEEKEVNAKASSSPVEDELSSIKDRIKKVESYRERYEAPGNPGITIAGTFLECVIDIAVALLRQSNIKKAALTLTDKENNGKVIAQMMRQITDEVVKVCEGTNFLVCKKCEDVQDEERQNASKKCKLVGEESSMDVSKDDCDRYVVHSENIESAVKSLLEKKVITNALSDDVINAIIDIAAYNAQKAGLKVSDKDKRQGFNQMRESWDSTRARILKDM